MEVSKENLTVFFGDDKVRGIYGHLALLTGLHLSPLQLSMYVYSCLALACFYILDSAVNAAYTAAFSLTWFLVLSRAYSDARGGSGVQAAGGPTMDEAAGFTSSEFNVSGAHVVAQPAAGLAGGQDAVAVASGGGNNPTAATTSLGHGVLMPESATSIAIIRRSGWCARTLPSS
ncbi:MAG: hypothetical protein M1832_000377 [Thelocarpon impressellum]|nr:MAG: hypothetical protein M1832_000377 [Thelocarpon impressellum]